MNTARTSLRSSLRRAPEAAVDSSAQSDANRAEWCSLPDETNPQFLLSLASKEVLLAAARGELDVMRLVREQLAARGLDLDGRWVGFDAAKKVHGV